MVAGLLYIIGLVATLVTVAMVGFAAPSLIQAFTATLDGPGGDYLTAIVNLARNLSWALGPFVGGLVVMGMGRIIFLLGAINRALRGTP